MRTKNLKFIIIVAISIIAMFFNPFGFDFNQQMVMGALLVAVACFATDVIHKSIACSLLLVSVAFFGQTPLDQIIRFAWSDTNLLIISTMLLSVAMMKTGIIHQAIKRLLVRFSSNMFLLLLLPYVIGIVLVFLIPQAFARVIIIGTILDGLLKASNQNEQKTKAVLLFNAFIGVSNAYMLFSNGDIVLNQSAIQFAGESIAVQLTFANWFIYMALPSVLTSLLAILVIKFVFKKELAAFQVTMLQNSQETKQTLTNQQQMISLIVMACILCMWMLSQMHQIPSFVFAIAGVCILFATNILNKTDLKAVNPHFLYFLMTVFSIGKILGQSGITNKIFTYLQQFMPQTVDGMYLFIVIILIMVLHLCIGSSVATMSVVLPILIPLLTSGHIPGVVVVLMTYVIVNIHFLLPFHHAIMLMGTGKNYYPERYLLRYGSVMTILTPIVLFLFYMVWWHFIGLI